MNILIIAVMLLVCGGVMSVRPIEGPGALVACAVVSAPTIFILARSGKEKTFLLRMFLVAVMVRIILGTIILSGHMENFFGGDAITYDSFGQSLMMSWHGDDYHAAKYAAFAQSGAGAWGMVYLVAGVYELVGVNKLAIQFINGSVGAATAVVVFYAAQTLFSNLRVSKLSALLVAFFPSLILWSSQGLKDALIVLALALSILATLRLMEKITAVYVLVLIASLLALLSLRFYIFYMMSAAVAGSFIIGLKTLSAQDFLHRFVAVTVIGLAFTWFGVLQYAGQQIDQFANLKAIQTSREDQAAAGSGFAKDVDIQTTEGALTAIPLGIVYLMFAPFPWEFETLRQSITLPEMVVWWLACPLLVLGWWYSI